MNLFDYIDYAAVNTKKPRKSDRILPAEDIAANAKRNAGLLADFTPVVGGIKGAYEEASAGNPVMSAINAATVPLDLLSGGSAGALAKAGLLGTFIGKGAKTWDKVKEADAMSRLAKGEDAAKVWKETGYGKAPWDKAARSEIDDSKAKILGGKLPTREIDGFGSVEDWKLPDAFSHEALYSAYPNTKNIESSFFNGKPHLAEYRDFGDGWISYSNSFKKPLPSQSQSDKYNAAKQAVKDFDSRPNVVAYNEELQSLDINTPDAVWDDVFNKHNGSQIEAERKPLVDSMLKINSEIKNNPQGGFGLLDNDPSKSTTLHELQHAIQQREGWAKGGSPEMFPDEQTINDARLVAARIANGEKPSEAAKWIATNLGRNPSVQVMDLAMKPKAELHSMPSNPHEGYQRLAGEAEARLTQARMNLSPEQRLAQYPYDPEYFKQATGVDINNLIVRGYGGKAMSLLDDVRPMTEYEKRHEIARQNAVKMLGLPENNTAMDRAKAMGAVDAYHGTTADVPEFDLKYYGSDGVAYKTPAIFSSTDTKLASDYAMNKFDRDISDAMRNLESYKRQNPGVYDDTYEKLRSNVSSAFKSVSSNGRPEIGGGANVMPLMIMGDFKNVDAKGARFMQAIPENLSLAKESGFDGVNFSNVIDNASPSTDYPSNVYAVFDPSKIRSRFAAFDPARAHEADILGYADPRLLGLIGGGGLLGLGAYKANKE